MSLDVLARHMRHPVGRGHTPADAFTGAAGGAACGDLVRISLVLDGEDPSGKVADAGFDASGCGTAIAAASVTVELVRDAGVLEAASIGAPEIADALGGLTPAKRHAAELAADALHRALGAATRACARLAPNPARVLVAMSGGVDSAVAALLVKQAGHEPVAVTLELWSDPENDGERSCCSPQAVRSARSLARRMGMAHFSIDLRAEFRAGVVEGWLSDHAAGLTPNPCVRCNGNVRLDAMLELAERLGASGLATGHYAQIDDSSREHPLLRLAADESKDQSYALAALSPGSLRAMRFPLGELTKVQVRALAERAGLEVARRPDSQDLCFLAGTERNAFLERHGALRAHAGAIVDRAGRKLAEHSGVHTVTVGQRHGVGVAGASEPLYVLATDARSNTVTVGPRSQLRTELIQIRDVTLHRDGCRVDAVKLRYRGKRMSCQVQGDVPSGWHAGLQLEMLDRVERTAPGQLACLYAGATIIGHGTVAHGG